jgi:tRNA A-37 threonylcarbamoyl transferase component Bud32
MSGGGADRDDRLAAVLDGLLQRQRQGDIPDFEAIAAEHPDLADELRELWGAAMIADLAGSDYASDATETGGNTASVAAASLPRVVGDYQLLEEIGRGGMGVVYKARQLSLGRITALKMLTQGELASDVERSRFQSEAESVARLDHPAIVPVYEIGQHEGHPFFSMKLIEGRTLAVHLADGPIPPREAARILAEVARGIHAAHQQGVLHRDLKPSNILLDHQMRPHVADFGLAKRMVGDASLTRTGAVLGTPSYMSPEQAAGSRGEITPASDVYSLGTILYQMLIGRPPFQAASPVDTVLMVLEQDVPPPRLVNPKVDRLLEMIALRCLQKPPELRYAGADKLADDLDAYLAGEPISARSGALSQVIARWLRQTYHATVLENWGLLWMLHSVLLLGLCLITNYFQLRQDDWPIMQQPWPYVLLWGGGIGLWAPIFWALRRRAGPVTFVERQIAHAWGASVICAIMLFVIESLLGLPVLALSPVLGVTSAVVFIMKAGILSGEFYFHAAALLATALVMAILQRHGYPYGLTLFGVVSAGTFFIPGLKYHRQRQGRNPSRAK